MKKIYIVIGALYFEKLNGNTYHNAKIICVCNNEIKTFYSGYKYGYDDAYLDTAKTFIKSTLKEKNICVIDGGSFYLPYRQVKNNNF
jgi:hypothetical protein